MGKIESAIYTYIYKTMERKAAMKSGTLLPPSGQKIDYVFVELIYLEMCFTSVYNHICILSMSKYDEGG